MSQQILWQWVSSSAFETTSAAVGLLRFEDLEIIVSRTKTKYASILIRFGGRLRSANEIARNLRDLIRRKRQGSWSKLPIQYISIAL